MSCCALALCECGACLACSCCQKCLGGALSQAARFGHLVLLVAIFGWAAIIGIYYPNGLNHYGSYSKIDLLDGCYDGYHDTCVYRQLIYRASFTLFLVFSMLAVGTYASDKLNKSMWPFKFCIAGALFVGFWWGGNSFFSGYAEFARVFSLFWLLAQGLLLLDFAHDIHDMILTKASTAEDESGSAKRWHIFYIVLSLAFLVAACVGLAFLFNDYAGCSMGTFFIVVTMLFGVLTTVLSLLETVNKGLLTPCIMFAYSVFMCWYALLSSPQEGCNPTADTNDGSKLTISITILICVTATAMLYCIANGTVILNAFSPQGEGVMQSYTPKKKQELNNVLTGEAMERTSGEKKSESQDEDAEEAEDKPSGTPMERSFFHILLVLLCINLTMMLTNWGKVNGSVLSDGSPDIAYESMWFKIISQWIFLAMYLRILQLAYIDNDDNTVN